uniref:tRNA(His) guanylyltransferase n=1 Tax=Glycine max TaxID=3847 RepID=I1MN70_SOYBN
MNGKEAWDFIKDFDKSELNNLLFDEFNVNYNALESIFRQGSYVLKIIVEDIVKHTNNDVPIKRRRSGFVEEINNETPEYVRSFEFDSKLMSSTWIVIHEFVKPNDDRTLNLMNLCAVVVLEKFWEDIVFAYGVSDEYSFILKKATNLYQRRANTIISAIVSFFTSTYVMRWKNFFPQSELKNPSSFDGRALCNSSTEILRDYLSWRQVDCHINNHYNSCFWKLVASRKSKRKAQNSLKGAQLEKKIEELAIDYNNLPVDTALIHQENGETPENYGKVIVGHIDIIGPTFWLEHPNILD